MNELSRLTARQTIALLISGEVTPLQLIDAAAERIAATDGAVNALPTLCLDRARTRAESLVPDTEDRPGRLHGLPIAVKDLTEVAGVRCTMGSPIFADHVPERSDILVERLEANGAIVVAKSNTPEFGAGANTFNEVFGTTRNPWDLTTTCGGSSGGSAAALAAGQVWLATGSDLGGSLRIPGSFCGVVGFRPSPGRIARAPSAMPFDDLSVQGPMGRTVGDAALMLDAMAGHHVRDPISLPAPDRPFLDAVDNPVAPSRVAFSPDLGIAPVDREVRAVCRAAADRFTEIGANLEADCIDFSDAEEIFQAYRARIFVTGRGQMLVDHRDQLKPEMIWNIEKGLALTLGELGRAERARAALYARVCSFFERYDLLVCPTVLVPPFDHTIRYLEQVGDVAYDNYVGWMVMTLVITLTTCPAISVPCGFTSTGLPIGLQIVGPPRGDKAVLSAAALFEQAAGFAGAVPIEPRSNAVPQA